MLDKLFLSVILTIYLLYFIQMRKQAHKFQILFLKL